MSRVITITAVSCLLLLGAGAPEKGNATKVLIAYYSAQGHTENMAHSVAKGARTVAGVEVKFVKIEDASSDDVVAADAIILGSPVYNANVAPAVQEFINGWPFRDSPLKDKIGAAFVTSGGLSAGEELTQLNMLHSMLMFGMIVVGGSSWKNAFGASGMVSEEPFDNRPRGYVDGYFLKKGEDLGKRVAELAVRLKGTK